MSLPVSVAGTPLARLSARELAAASLIANGMDYGPAFVAAGFPKRSAGVRASERKNQGAFAYFREAVRYLIDSRFQALAGKAVSTLEVALISGKDDARIRAALALLDRAGFSAIRQVEVTHHQPLSGVALIKSIREMLLELPEPDRLTILSGVARGAQGAIDAECSEVPEGEDEGR